MRICGSAGRANRSCSAIPRSSVPKKRTDAQEFFTFRVINPSYTTENDLILPHEGSNGVKFVPDNGHRHNTAWKWISIYPQAKMMRKGTDTVEEMCVSVAQNWSAGKGLTAMNAGDHVFGRGYTHANGPDSSEYAITHGLNFAEQWSTPFRWTPRSSTSPAGTSGKQDARGRCGAIPTPFRTTRWTASPPRYRAVYRCSEGSFPTTGWSPTSRRFEGHPHARCAQHGHRLRFRD